MPAYRGLFQQVLPAVLRTTSNQGGIINLGTPGGPPSGGTFALVVSASNTPTSLDVYIQTSPNQGTTWYDFIHFAQVGAVSSYFHSVQWSRKGQALNTTGTGVTVTGDAALAQGVVLNTPIVDNYVRVKWVMVGTSYTFQIVAALDRD